jgi:hypothetical protein
MVGYNSRIAFKTLHGNNYHLLPDLSSYLVLYVYKKMIYNKSKDESGTVE